MKKSMRAIAVYIFVLACALPQTGTTNGGMTPWKEEFERICAQTEIATTLSRQQLLELIEDSDELLNRLTGVEDPWAKVYILRLKNCREFFRYTLEWQGTGLQEDTS